jgi:hypothetical protein
MRQSAVSIAVIDCRFVRVDRWVIHFEVSEIPIRFSVRRCCREMMASNTACADRCGDEMIWRCFRCGARVLSDPRMAVHWKRVAFSIVIENCDNLGPKNRVMSKPD